ncbi:hypothetical protein [Rhodanobacter sp. C03]|uniref:hypothetical protein n=1 Tax=Rhodanobacter sp. C03 TaxID=1945858 RepID=UPI000985FD57|nr:hypothetical protein [Rhodanobacter sp. C03]OOG59540.1 hypothetical protein B0E48_01620 [Rhodanobacter sp. C03]
MVLVLHDQSARPRGLTIWRVLVWALLLFSALGCLQYVRHAQLVWEQLQGLAPAQPDAVAALRGMLGWDAAYLLAALVLIVVCAGCILRQAWARPCMRVAALALAVWLLFSGILLLREWQSISASASGTQLSAAMQQQLPQVYRTMQLALVFNAVAVPLLLWLSWRLGRPTVRAQFRSRRR